MLLHGLFLNIRFCTKVFFYVHNVIILLHLIKISVLYLVVYPAKHKRNKLLNSSKINSIMFQQRRKYSQQKARNAHSAILFIVNVNKALKQKLQHVREKNKNIKIKTA